MGKLNQSLTISQTYKKIMKLLVPIFSTIQVILACTDKEPELCGQKFSPEKWRIGCKEMPSCINEDLKNTCCKSCKEFAEMYQELRVKNWPACDEAAKVMGRDKYDEIVSDILNF